MRKFRMSTCLSVTLFVYTTLVTIFFIPYNVEMTKLEKWLTVILSYVIIMILWVVLRKKEKMREMRERDWDNKK
ncbi:MAG: hypothetical protein K2G02_01375 [Phocaeicola sp.]|uniref:hypothetical protein n=1 Tax=Phocaeicola sp. TaxID=2773926 RepID=UPI0023CDE1B3|nr:hypothetical protein [Phocaeicola sp.]MDE5677136.1 hypothetical protein [Phocaeicola sp.]MDE6179784.1 hypothetical protein [Phocaeicola sp.]